MNKKLLAVAVAGALAAPGVALAQASSVTISGIFKTSLDQVSYSRATTNTLTAPGVIAGNAQRLGNSSETRLSDNSSRILFNVREDLGNGLAAVAQLDQRFETSTQPAPQGNSWANATGGGNTWVGLDSKSWGRLTAGQWDLHYGKSGDSWNAAGAGSLQVWGSALFDSIGRPVAATATTAKSTANASLASQTRTKQVIRWDSPDWQGFSGTVAYSANPLTAGAGTVSTGGDLGAPLPGTGPNLGSLITRKGQGWNINPRYTAANWGVEYSYWNAKGDINSAGVNIGNANCVNAATACTGATVAGAAVGQALIQDDQRSDVLAGNVKWMGWTFGLAWNRSKTTNVASGLVTGDRSAWSIPISYTTGPHLFGFDYVKANDSKDVTSVAGSAGGNGYPVIAAGGTLSGSDTGAKMFSLTYQYSLSKRTSLGVSWAQITNSVAGAYNFFYNTPVAFGSANTGALPGEKIQLGALTLRHAF